MMVPSRIGFVGLGKMGRPMAARLLAAGFSLSLFDERREAMDAVPGQHGGEAAASLAALAAASEVVITMLPNGEVVRRVLLDTDRGMADHLAPGTTVIDMSSSAPTGTQALGRELSNRGIAMLDAPVSGGVVRAEAGTLSIMVGGDPAVIERCRPVLGPLGARIFETGSLGSGHAMKALNNLVSAAGFIAAAEALLIGHRFGLDPAVMIDVLNASSGRNNSTESKFKQFVLSRTFASGFALDLMVKDLGTAIALAEATESPAPFSRQCRDLWATARQQLGPDADHTAVVRWLEQLAGTTLGS